MGPNTFCHWTNENGNELKNIVHIFDLSIKNTWSKNKTCLQTCSNGKSTSQIDHILVHNSIMASNVNAKWAEDISTDHKILFTDLKDIRHKNHNGKNGGKCSHIAQINVGALKAENIRIKYMASLEAS